MTFTKTISIFMINGSLGLDSFSKCTRRRLQGRTNYLGMTTLRPLGSPAWLLFKPPTGRSGDQVKEQQLDLLCYVWKGLTASGLRLKGSHVTAPLLAMVTSPHPSPFTPPSPQKGPDSTPCCVWV